MTTIEFRFKPLPKQREFIFSPKPFSGFVGGVGSGKTLAGAVKTIIQSIQLGKPGVIVAPTYPMLRDATAYTLLNDVLIPWGIPYSYNKSDAEIEVYNTRILLRSADKPDRLRGPNLAWAWLDEAAMMRASVWDIILGRLRMGPPIAWITTTPAGYNWVYRSFVERGDDNYHMVQARTFDNKYLPGEYIESLQAAYTGEFAKQELEGEFTYFEGLVYSEYRGSVHSPDFQPAKGWRLVRAIDHGFTNPFVCLFGAIDEDDRLYIYDEYYQAKRLIKDHVVEINKREGNFAWTVADHDAQDNAELRENGIVTQNARKAVIEGIQRVKARLVVQKDDRPRLFIHPRCKNLIRELQSYRWAETKEGVNEKEEPVKENDHAMDALRYMVMAIDKPTVYMPGIEPGRMGL